MTMSTPANFTSLIGLSGMITAGTSAEAIATSRYADTMPDMVDWAVKELLRSDHE